MLRRYWYKEEIFCQNSQNWALNQLTTEKDIEIELEIENWKIVEMNDFLETKKVMEVFDPLESMISKIKKDYIKVKR